MTRTPCRWWLFPGYSGRFPLSRRGSGFYSSAGLSVRCSRRHYKACAGVKKTHPAFSCPNGAIIVFSGPVRCPINNNFPLAARPAAHIYAAFALDYSRRVFPPRVPSPALRTFLEFTDNHLIYLPRLKRVLTFGRMASRAGSGASGASSISRSRSSIGGAVSSGEGTVTPRAAASMVDDCAS